MDPQNRAERLRQTDQFKRDFEHANTELGLRAMSLRTPDTDPQQLKMFVEAGIKLAKVCENQYATEHPLNVLFWLRNKLQAEAFKPCRSCIYRAACHSETAHVRRCIRALCQSIGGSDGRILPFLIPESKERAYA